MSTTTRHDARGRVADERIPHLAALERKALWLSTWTIHAANHLRRNDDGLKVGGHQASSASLATILTALYGAVLRPEDRVAVKPHASPVFHALQYLFGRQTRDKLEAFRAFGGAQSYPSRTKDSDDVDFSTGSVGLGVAQTLFSAIVQDYVAAKGWLDRAEGKMVALVGDAEMDEGNIYEALIEGWKHGLRNTWWVVDYNRQSLDAVVREGLWAKFEAMFANFGWDVVIVKYGALQEAAFTEPGGEALKHFIDTCPNQDYAALCFQGGAAWRRRLLEAIGDQGPATALIERRGDEELALLMTNLGGHDLPNLVAAFEAARATDRPTCFICYTVKGHGLPLQGHKDNHAGQLTATQVEALRAAHGVRPGHEFDPFEGLDLSPTAMRRFIDRIPFLATADRRREAAVHPVPARIDVTIPSETSTQQGFGALLHELAKGETALAEHIVTTSPDVTVSTNLGAWVNRRGLFAREAMVDVFRREKIPSTFNWDFSPKGQHLELGIAESNLFTVLSAFGLAHSLHGRRIIPVGTLYDPFIYRGADAMNYACYQDARFILAATPSGITLAGEGGAHQSIGTPLIGMAQPGLAAFEPAFVDELEVILRWAFAHVQKGDGHDGEEAGGSVYLRLSTRPIAQPRRALTQAQEADIVAGGYWLRPPGPNCRLIVAVSGAVTPEAADAVGILGERQRDTALLAITSADRLHAGWSRAQAARERGVRDTSHVERLLAMAPRDARLVTVCDAHPAALGWLGSVDGRRTRALGVQAFGQTGSLADLYRHYGIDADAILAAARALGA